jgi:hypothetical protein
LAATNAPIRQSAAEYPEAYHHKSKINFPALLGRVFDGGRKKDAVQDGEKIASCQEQSEQKQNDGSTELQDIHAMPLAMNSRVAPTRL